MFLIPITKFKIVLWSRFISLLILLILLILNKFSFFIFYLYLYLLVELIFWKRMQAFIKIFGYFSLISIILFFENFILYILNIFFNLEDKLFYFFGYFFIISLILFLIILFIVVSIQVIMQLYWGILYIQRWKLNINYLFPEIQMDVNLKLKILLKLIFNFAIILLIMRFIFGYEFTLGDGIYWTLLIVNLYNTIWLIQIFLKYR